MRPAPTPPPTTRCVGCHRPIEPADAFCVLCGADNRDPMIRVPILPHAHDARGMGYCRVCGRSSGAAPDDPENPPVYFVTPWPLLASFVASVYLFAALAIPLPGYPAIRWLLHQEAPSFRGYHHDEHYPLGEFALVILIFLWGGAYVASFRPRR